MTTRTAWALACALPASALALAACTAAQSDDDVTVAVSSTDDACEIAQSSAPAGNVVFSVTNDGSQETEFYVYEEDGTTIVAEVENVGPGLTRELVAKLDPGTYVTACDPGMDGSDFRAEFTATEAGQAPAPTGDHAAALDQASAEYLALRARRGGHAGDKTTQFSDAFAAGDDDAAKGLYADARVHWERIEPIAESFGDLDPLLDLREADLGPDQEHGWAGTTPRRCCGHRLRATPWTMPRAPTIADQPGQRHGGVAVARQRGGLHGRGLPDRQRRQGTSRRGRGHQDHRRGGHLVRHRSVGHPGQHRRRPAGLRVVATRGRGPRPRPWSPGMDERFAAGADVLDTHGSSPTGFTQYGDLTPRRGVELSRSIEALSEPLSQLTAAAVL